MESITHLGDRNMEFDRSDEFDQGVKPFVRSPVQEHERKLSKASSYAHSKKKLSEIHTDLLQL